MMHMHDFTAQYQSQQVLDLLLHIAFQGAWEWKVLKLSLKKVSELSRMYLKFHIHLENIP